MRMEALFRLSPRARDSVICVALFTFGMLLALPHFWESPQWNPDALFYQAQIHQLQGEGRYRALDKVFASALASREKAREAASPPSLQRIDNSAWVDYSSRFYRRRWTVPLLADAISPIGGTDSLEYVSLIGFALIAPLAYLLLRSRFRPLVSAPSAVFCTLLPPLLALLPHPNTDTWGLALLLAALIVALRLHTGGWRWLPLWILVILVLSFTRDDAIVALTGVAGLAWSNRSRVLLAATATGVLASLLAPLLFASPIKANLAYVLNDYRIPAHTGWDAIVSKYPGVLGSLIKLDFRYPVESAVPVLTFAMGLVVLAGLAMLLFRRHQNGPLVRIARGSLVGAAITILVSVNYTAMRLELVFLPAVAVGVALLLEYLLARITQRRHVAAEPAPGGGRPVQSAPAAAGAC
jgi:hypothetical protein